MKMNKKGFTIVELVIVIAVIAILAGVMIPTFGGVINDANEKAALQEATAAYKAIFIAVEDKTELDSLSADGVDFYIVIDDEYVFAVTNGQVALNDAATTSYATDKTITGYEKASDAHFTGYTVFVPDAE